MIADHHALPQGWTRAPLGEVADLALGKMLDKAKRIAGTPMPYLRNINVRWHVFDLHDVHEMPFQSHEVERYSAREGDVMICEGGEPGRAAVWTGPAIMFQKALHRVRPRSNAFDPRWLVWHLRHDAATGRLADSFTGTTIKHLTGSSLARYEVLLPPLAEQRRIVSKLDELLASSRTAGAALDAVPALLDQYRQAVLAAAFTGSLTADWRALRAHTPNVASALDAEPNRRGRAAPDISRPDDIPETWGWERLGALGLDPSAAVQTGPFGAQLHSDEFVPQGVPVIAVGNLTGIGFTSDGLYHVTPEKAAALARYDVNAGDLLFARSGATLGKVCVAPAEARDWRMTGHILRVRLAEELIDPHLVAFALWGDPRVKQQVVGGIRGMTRPGYNTALLETIAVAVPPRDEQCALVARIREAFERIDAVERLLDELARRRSLLERATLAKAFRGELVLQDPTDESAAAVVARLRLERLPAPARRRRIAAATE